MTTKTKKKPPLNKKICSKCESAKHPTEEYYMASDDLIFKDRRLPICKTCLIDIVDMNNVESVIEVLRKLDKPFIKEVYIACLDEKYNNNPFGEYMRRVGMPQHRELNYSNSVFGDKPKNDKEVTKPDISDIAALNKSRPSNLTEDELDELVNFFGEGYEEKDYIYLASEYDDYLNRYEVDSKTLENLIKEICLTQLDIRKKRAMGDKVDQQQKTLQDLLGSSNLKPVQETGNQAVEQETFGTLIKRWEQERPVPEPLESWYQENDVGKYLRVWFTGHLMRMFGVENDNEDEYRKEVNNYTIEKEEDDLKDG